MLSAFLLQITQTGTALADTVNTAISQTAQTAPSEIRMSYWELARYGGWINVIIGIMSLIAIYIFIERYIAVTRASRVENNFMNNIRDYIHENRVDKALSFCKNNPSPISRMIEKGLTRLGRPFHDISSAIENVGQLEVARLERNMVIIGTVAGAAPMLGFLGTVTGMVRAFYDMSMAGNNIDISLLSAGIYQAMVTTVAGLIVGILAYVCYNLMVSKIEKVVLLLEVKANEFMDVLQEPAA